MNARTFRIGGVHPEENKLTHEVATQVAALPKQAIFPLGQHIGAPAKPVVQKGDKVKVGTMIAEAGGFVSAPIFSSVSGTVFKAYGFFLNLAYPLARQSVFLANLLKGQFRAVNAEEGRDDIALALVENAQGLTDFGL